jgi:hypothetical protein
MDFVTGNFGAVFIKTIDNGVLQFARHHEQHFIREHYVKNKTDITVYAALRAHRSTSPLC